MNFYSIQLRQDTLSNWNLHPDLVLKAGEIALVSTADTTSYDAYKIGDGTTAFSELPLYYLILSDSDGNPIVLNPETGIPLDFAQIDEYTKKVDLSLSHDFIVELSPLLRISALQTGKTYPRPFLSDVSGLQVGRTYNIVPTEAALSGQVTLLSKDTNTGAGHYLLELTSIYYMENLCKVVLMMYGSPTEDTWQATQVQSQVLPYNHNIDLSSELSTFDDLHYRVIIARQTNTPLFVTYLGDIYYNPSILRERIMFIKFSPNTLPENQESMEYLRLDFLYVEKGIDPGVEYNITTHTRFIRILKEDERFPDLWVVKLPSAMGQMIPQQVLPVEDIWGSVEEFQKWIEGLDPEKQGVSAWDALLTYNHFTRRGTLSKRVDVVSGIEVPYYFASLVREDNSGLYIDRYKIYNNPDNNTVPIGDVVGFMGSYPITEVDLSEYLKYSDVLSKLIKSDKPVSASAIIEALFKKQDTISANNGIKKEENNLSIDEAWFDSRAATFGDVKLSQADIDEILDFSRDIAYELNSLLFGEEWFTLKEGESFRIEDVFSLASEEERTAFQQADELILPSYYYLGWYDSENVDEFMVNSVVEFISKEEVGNTIRYLYSDTAGGGIDSMTIVITKSSPSLNRTSCDIEFVMSDWENSQAIFKDIVRGN